MKYYASCRAALRQKGHAVSLGNKSFIKSVYVGIKEVRESSHSNAKKSNRERWARLRMCDGGEAIIIEKETFERGGGVGKNVPKSTCYLSKAN